MFIAAPNMRRSPVWYELRFDMICSEFISQVSSFPPNLVLLPSFAFNKFEDDGIHFAMFEVFN